MSDIMSDNRNNNLNNSDYLNVRMPRDVAEGWAKQKRWWTRWENITADACREALEAERALKLITKEEERMTKEDQKKIKQQDQQDQQKSCSHMGRVLSAITGADYGPATFKGIYSRCPDCGADLSEYGGTFDYNDYNPKYTPSGSAEPEPLRSMGSHPSDERARLPLTPEKLAWLETRAHNTGEVLHSHPWDEQLWADLTEGVMSLLATLKSTRADERRVVLGRVVEKLEALPDADALIERRDAIAIVWAEMEGEK